MNTDEMIKIIRQEYAGVVEALKKTEQEHNADKRSVKKREVFQFVAAQEMELTELCHKLGIELHDENFELETRRKINIKDVAKLLDKYHKKYYFHQNEKSIKYFFENGDFTIIEIGDDHMSVSFEGKIIGDLEYLEQLI